MIRARWNDIMSGELPCSVWRLKRLDCTIVEAILLDKIEPANPEETTKLLKLLRESGLLEMRILEARAQLMIAGRLLTPQQQQRWRNSRRSALFFERG